MSATDIEIDALCAPNISITEGTRPTIPRDHLGRYILPTDDGRKAPHTRVTTVSGTLPDSYAIHRANLEKIVWGLCQREDLIALVRSVPRDDRTAIQFALRQAEQVAAVDEGANLGTAWHNILQRVDTGEDWQVTVPEYFHQGIRNYLAALAEHGLTVLPQYVERVVRCGLYDTAGTLDNVLRESDGTLVVADKKTGDWEDKYPHGSATQQAIYNHADAMMDYTTGQYIDMPPVRQDYALIIHLDKVTHQVRVLKIDTRRGWWSVELAIGTRGWRAQTGLLSAYIAPGLFTKADRTGVSLNNGQKATTSVPPGPLYPGQEVTDESHIGHPEAPYGYQIPREDPPTPFIVPPPPGNYSRIDALVRDAASTDRQCVRGLTSETMTDLNRKAAEIVRQGKDYPEDQALRGEESGFGDVITSAHASTPEARHASQAVVVTRPKLSTVTKEMMADVIASGVQLSANEIRRHAFAKDDLPAGEQPDADPPLDFAAEVADMTSHNQRPALQERAYRLGVTDLRHHRKWLAEAIVRRRTELRAGSTPASPGKTTQRPRTMEEAGLSPARAQPPNQPVAPTRPPAVQDLTEAAVLARIQQATARSDLAAIYESWVTTYGPASWVGAVREAADRQLAQIQRMDEPPF